MSASPSIPESRSTSAILTVLGREAPTRTPTDCCASISRGERVSPTTPRNTWTWLPPSSMGDLAKPSAGSRRLSDSPSFWKYRQQQVLRPPHETTRQINRIRKSAPPERHHRHVVKEGPAFRPSSQYVDHLLCTLRGPSLVRNLN